MCICITTATDALVLKHQAISIHGANLISWIVQNNYLVSIMINTGCKCSMPLISKQWWLPTVKSFRILHHIVTMNPMGNHIFQISLELNRWDHDEVIKWKLFPNYWPFVRGIHRWPVGSPHKGQWRRALMFSLICALNKQLSKQSWGWWFEMPSRSLWRHCNVIYTVSSLYHDSKH